MTTELHHLVRRQHGLITTEQATQFGVSQDQLAGKVRRQEWRRIRRGVYFVLTTAPTWFTKQLAITLRRRCVLSHRSAAKAWNLEVVRPARTEITVPHGFRRISSAVVHQTEFWELRAETERAGIACTGIERTIIDCAAVVRPPVLERLAESAIRQRLTTWHHLADAMWLHRHRGRDGIASAATLIEHRLASPVVTRSDFSNQVRDLLIAAGVREPVVEHPIADQLGRHILSVDLAWPSRRLAWELDSRTFHFDTRSFERDRHKRNALAAMGWTLQVITWKMFNETPQQVVALARQLWAG